MTLSFFVVVSAVVVAIAAVVVPAAFNAYFRFRGRRAVICPETEEVEIVELDATRAAVSTAFGAPKLRIVECSRWPQNAGCDQACAKGIAKSPEEGRFGESPARPALHET